MHPDVKKVGQIPPGGGWRIHGRGSPAAKRKRRPVGYRHLHVAIDDYSRVAYVEAHDDETAKTLVGFWRRAQGWFWSNDMAVDEVLTDNGPNFVSDAFAEVLAERAIMHRRTRPYRPQTNAKAERFNRTLAGEILPAGRSRRTSEHHPVDVAVGERPNWLESQTPAALNCFAMVDLVVEDLVGMPFG